MPRRIALIGAPSSAGAYAAGQEQAPAALRDAGLVGRLRERGVEVDDRGDLPRLRWRPDRARPRAQNLEAVVATASAVRRAAAQALAEGRFALVLGGDCTVGLGTIAAAVEAGPQLGLVYVDMHADLNVPGSVVDGALDWMGVAHLLGLDGCEPALRDVAGRGPLLAPSQLVVLGHEQSQATAWEREAIEGLGLPTVAAAELRRDAAAAAASALAALPAGCERVLVHLDVDVVDFTDAPLSENTGRNVGVPLDAALAALERLLADPRAAALTVTELNPLHAAADPASLERLVQGLVRALAR
jgi:arginase